MQDGDWGILNENVSEKLQVIYFNEISNRTLHIPKHTHLQTDDISNLS